MVPWKALGLSALLLVSGALAGCLEDVAAPETSPTSKEPVNRGGTTRVTPPSTTPSGTGAARDANVTAGQRWHFHNYWGLSPTITLLDANVSLAWEPAAQYPPARLVVGATEFTIPRGKIVPPETGRIDVNLTWTDPPVPYRLNLSYRHGNAAGFTPFGVVQNGQTVTIPVSEDMTDYPHRAESAWAFRLEAAPGEAGLGVANGTIHVVIQATIGRPIFIDPPHPDFWKGAETIALAAYAETVKTVGARAGLVHARLQPETQNLQTGETLAKVTLPEGKLVPVDATVVLVRLKWQSDAPGAPIALGLSYHERNAGTGGELPPAEAGEGYRLYRIPLETRMGDAPYARTSTWAFDVLVDGQAGAFEGAFSLEAWASRLPADAATFPQ